MKDNIGLIPVSETFIDCFILQLKNRLDETDHASCLRNLINSYGMVLASILIIENDKFKVAYPDFASSLIINFIDSLNSTNFKLNCVDVTQDYAVSFDKEELKHHLMEECEFVQEDFISKLHLTIIKPQY